jgi:hypothetical protein
MGQVRSIRIDYPGAFYHAMVDANWRADGGDACDFKRSDGRKALIGRIIREKHQRKHGLDCGTAGDEERSKRQPAIAPHEE